MNYLTNFFRFLTAPLRVLVALPLRLLGAPRRLMGMSLPMRVAVLLACFLVFLTILASVFYLLTRDAGAFNLYANWWRILGIVVLLALIPVMTYHALRLWLEGDLSRFPDIDQAWREGLAAMEEQQLDLAEIPLYLVIGCPNEQTADNMMRASGMEFLVNATPSGRFPLRWYASDRMIFLFCLGSSCLSKLNTGSTTTGPSAPITGTLVAGSAIADTGPSWEDSASASSAREVRGTLVAGGIQGTLTPGQAVAAPPSGSEPVGVPKSLTRQEMEEMSERFGYICELLRRARQPLCPLNGVVTMLPLPTVQDILVAKDMPESIRRDLRTIRQAAQLSCPVTAVVSGMEKEQGFSELVRRVGSSRAKNSRFGKGFHVRNMPDGENLEALAAEACGAFEDWVYTLFREEDGLNKPGNGKLYSLLCTIRSQLQQRLRNILLRGFSSDPADGGNEDEPELFSGCYFAATGDTQDRQAFVRSVLEKVTQLEEELQWTDDALREDDRFHRLASAGMFVNGLLLLAIVALVVIRVKGG